MLHYISKSLGIGLVAIMVTACASGEASSEQEQSSALELDGVDLPLTEDLSATVGEETGGESAAEGISFEEEEAQAIPPIQSLTHTFSLPKGTQQCFDLGYVFTNSNIFLSMTAQPKARVFLRRRITLGASWQTTFDSGIKYNQYAVNVGVGPIVGYYQVCIKAGTDLPASGNITYSPSNACP